MNKKQLKKRKRAKKIKRLKNTKQFSQYYNQKREVIKPKVDDKPITENIMPERIKKLLFLLPADSKISRIVRRGIIVAVLTFVAILVKEGLMPVAPSLWIPILTGILASVDKILGEQGIR